MRKVTSAEVESFLQKVPFVRSGQEDEQAPAPKEPIEDPDLLAHVLYERERSSTLRYLKMYDRQPPVCIISRPVDGTREQAVIPVTPETINVLRTRGWLRDTTLFGDLQTILSAKGNEEVGTRLAS